MSHDETGVDTPLGQLSTRISAVVLTELDRWNSAFFDLDCSQSELLQDRLEQEITAAVRRWLTEQGIDLRKGRRYRDQDRHFMD
jgi:hypothetical protein